MGCSQTAISANCLLRLPNVQYLRQQAQTMATMQWTERKVPLTLDSPVLPPHLPKYVPACLPTYIPTYIQQLWPIAATGAGHPVGGQQGGSAPSCYAILCSTAHAYTAGRHAGLWGCMPPAGDIRARCGMGGRSGAPCGA
jgi:hypothetical protein